MSIRLMLAAALCVGIGTGVGAEDPMKGSTRNEKEGWIYVHLEGPAYNVGFQHGSLLAPEITDLLAVMKAYLKGSTRRDWSFYREAAEKIMWPGIDSEYRNELDGIVTGFQSRGGKADRWDIVALNAMEELAYYYVPWLEKQKGLKPTTHSPGNCSAFVATGSWTKDRKIVMGHNAWTNYAVGARWNIIFDIKPERGHRILMDGLPGVIASDDDFGINSAGIMITETTITGFDSFDPKGTPEFYRARKAMQYSNSIDDFVRIMLDRNNGGYANDWLLGDNKTGEIALFELGLLEHSVRKSKDGYFVGANFPVDPKLIRNETNFDVNKKDSSPNARRTRWEHLMKQHKGKIDIEAAKAFEADRVDVIDPKAGPSERSLCGCVETSARGIPEWDWGPFFPGGTVQSKAVDGALTSRMQIWAAMGRQCAGDFKAEEFLKARPEYAWMRGILRDLPTKPWALFSAP